MKIDKCKSKGVLPKPGTEVRTTKTILHSDRCGGFFVKKKHIDARMPDRDGLYVGYVPGGGGDLWWVQHEDGSVGCYMSSEVTDRK